MKTILLIIVVVIIIIIIYFNPFKSSLKKVPIKTEHTPIAIRTNFTSKNRIEIDDNHLTKKVNNESFGMIEKMIVVLNGDPS